MATVSCGPIRDADEREAVFNFCLDVYTPSTRYGEPSSLGPLYSHSTVTNKPELAQEVTPKAVSSKPVRDRAQRAAATRAAGEMDVDKIRNRDLPYCRIFSRTEEPLDNPKEAAGPLAEPGQDVVTASNRIGNIRVNFVGETEIQYWVLAYAQSKKAGHSTSIEPGRECDGMTLRWIPFTAAECPFRLFFSAGTERSVSTHSVGNPIDLQPYRITLANPRRPSWVLKETASGSKYRVGKHVDVESGE